MMPNTIPFIYFAPNKGTITISAAGITGSYTITIQGTYTPTGQIIV